MLRNDGFLGIIEGHISKLICDNFNGNGLETIIGGTVWEQACLFPTRIRSVTPDAG
jgi:hypothetical protein